MSIRPEASTLDGRNPSASGSTSGAPPVVVTASRGFGPRFAMAMARNPLGCLPAECFEHFLVRGWGPFGRALHVTDPDLIADVLVRRAELFGKTPVNRRVLAPTLGEGLLVAEGAPWRWQRRASAPAFQPGSLVTFAPAMLAAARNTRDRWLAQPGTVLRLNHEMMGTTFAIILDTMLGGDRAVDADRFERAMNATLAPVGWNLLGAMLGLPEGFPHPGRQQALAASAYLRRVTASLVAAHQGAGAERPNLLTLLSGAPDPESGRLLGDVQLVDNLLTFIAAGHETTALGLTWTLQLLADHPEVEARAVDEIQRVVGEGEVAPEHISGLSYLRQVFSEALRLFPPAPLLARAAQQRTVLGGVPLERGDEIAIPIYALHRHHELWCEPERFDPDRFAPENSAGRHRFAFMPFGGGPHVCIGTGFAMQEALAILAVLLQRFRVRLCPGAPRPTAVMKVTLRPSTDPLVRAEPR